MYGNTSKQKLAPYRSQKKKKNNHNQKKKKRKEKKKKKNKTTPKKKKKGKKKKNNINKLSIKNNKPASTLCKPKPKNISEQT